MLCSDELEGGQTSDGCHRSAAGYFVLKMPENTNPMLSCIVPTPMQQHWLHRCGLLPPFSGGILRANTVVLCRGLFVSPPFARPTVSPPKRLIADLSNHQQATTSTSVLPLWDIKAQYLEQLDTNCVWAGPTLGGNGRSQWPKKVTMLRIRGRTLGSDPELNRAEVQTEHHLTTNSALNRLTETRERAVPPVYEEHLRCIILLLPKMGFRSFLLAVSFRRRLPPRGRQKCMESVHKSQLLFKSPRRRCFHLFFRASNLATLIDHQKCTCRNSYLTIGHHGGNIGLGMYLSKVLS